MFKICYTKIKQVLILLAIFLISIPCESYSEEDYEKNIRAYMESNQQTYPVHINTSLDNTFYRTSTDEEELDFEITPVQKEMLERFVRAFMSSPEHIEELIRQSQTETFSVNSVFIEYSDWKNEDHIVLGIVSYSDRKIYEMWQYSEENKFWWHLNLAYYSFDDNGIELLGWGF